MHIGPANDKKKEVDGNEIAAMACFVKKDVNPLTGVSLNPLRDQKRPAVAKSATTTASNKKSYTSSSASKTRSAKTAEYSDDDSGIKENTDPDKQGTVIPGKFCPSHIGFTWERGTTVLYTLIVSINSGLYINKSLNGKVKAYVKEGGLAVCIESEFSTGSTSETLLKAAMADYTKKHFVQNLMTHAFRKEVISYRKKLNLSEDTNIGATAEIELPYECELSAEWVKTAEHGSSNSVVLYITLKKVQTMNAKYNMDVLLVDADMVSLKDDDSKGEYNG